MVTVICLFLIINICSFDADLLKQPKNKKTQKMITFNNRQVSLQCVMKFITVYSKIYTEVKLLLLLCCKDFPANYLLHHFFQQRIPKVLISYKTSIPSVHSTNGMMLFSLWCAHNTFTHNPIGSKMANSNIYHSNDFLSFRHNTEVQF